MRDETLSVERRICCWVARVRRRRNVVWAGGAVGRARRGGRVAVVKV